MVSTSALETEKEVGGSKKSKKKKLKKETNKEQKKSKERVHRCNRCNKSYLSYPALYTHTKLKHVNAKDNSSITNGRMRGRPKKAAVFFIFYIIECEWEE